MRIVLGVLLGLATAMALWLVFDARSDARNDLPVGIPGDANHERDGARAHDQDRLSELERKLANLEVETRRLAAELERQALLPRTPVSSAFVAAPAEVKRGGDGFDPRWYLEQYARSFQGGGEGSEYFRLAVDAYALELANEIGDLLRDGGAHATLRAKLAALLGTPRFARNGNAIESLLAVVRSYTAGSGGPGDKVMAVALDGLAVIGDADTAITLERMIWSMGSPEIEKRMLAVLVQLGGPDANRALQRLFASAQRPDARVLVIAALSTGNADAALEVFRQASAAEDAVRLQAAQTIHRFRGDAFIAFIDQWLGYEREPRVRQLLGEGRARMSQVQPYAAQKAAGPPDADASQDHPNAWASLKADMGMQWLDLRYQPARRASAVRIYEVSVAGAVVQVLAFDESGRKHELWAGVDPTPRPGIFEVKFAPTAFAVKRVRIVLDTNKSPGWSEIDAVELVGPDGNAWAVEATASSSYGQ